MLSRDSFFNYSSKTFVSSLKLQFAAHLLGKCGDRLFTSEQGCVGSLSNLGDFEISQMSCFAKFCKCPPCARVVIFRLDCEIKESVIDLLSSKLRLMSIVNVQGSLEDFPSLDCSEVYDRLEGRAPHTS